jgi:hypothetical protein
MADNLLDPTADALNRTNFANLSRMLLDNQIVSLSACFERSQCPSIDTTRSWRGRIRVNAICLLLGRLSVFALATN